MAQNALAFAIPDKFPVSEGHTLIVTRRLVETWFDATRDEQLAVLELIDVVKKALDAVLHPDGYNLGINVGRIAGQTVPHLHVHVIPRYEGDVRGVRHVVPRKGRW